MTPHDRFERQLPDALARLAAARVPDYLDDLLATTARSRQRPAWTHIERWLPMSFVRAHTTAAPSLRPAWMLLLVALLTIALAASLAIAGSLVRRPAPQHLQALIPVLQADDPWDDTAAPLVNPTGIAVGPDDDVYVVSSGSNEIVVIDPHGVRAVRRWGSTGTGDGQFIFQREPSDPLAAVGGIGVGHDGSVYVADQTDRVQRFTSDGRFVQAWGGHGAADGQFLEPVDVSVGPDGSVFVVDDLRDDIQRFSPDGEWLQTIGRHGEAEGEMDFTGGIDVGDDGMLLNADFGNARIQAWDADGTFLWARSAGLVNPNDIVVDHRGHVIVSDDEGLKVFTDGPAPVSLERPTDWVFGSLAVAADGSVYASSSATNSIRRFTVDLQRPHASPALAAAADRGESGSASPEPGSSLEAPLGPGGAQTMDIGGVFPVPFSVQLPSTSEGDAETGPVRPGWRVQTLEPGAVSFQYVRDADRWPAYVTVYLPVGVFADPCHPDEGVVELSDDPGVDEFVDAITGQPGYRAGPVTDVSFGNVRGRTFQLENSIDARTCTDDPWLRQWTYHVAGLSSEAEGESEGLPNTHQRIALVDVGGVLVLIEAWELGALRDEVLEMEALVDSIRFE